MLSIENLEKELKNGNLQSLYLLYGEELFLLEMALKKIKDLFGECIKGINFISIDDTNINQILSEIETPAFGYEKKLVIARNTGLLKKEGKRKNTELSTLKEKIDQYLNKNMETIKQSNILVFVEEEVDVKQELYKTIEKQGTICEFSFQKPIQIIKRLKRICTAYKVQVEENTLQYLIECCGTNMQELMNEIRKLIEYVGENGTIQKKDIDKLATKKIESIIFDLTDNLGKKEVEKALEVLNNLIYSKEPIQKILITLYNHFKKVYFTKLAIEQKVDIATSINLKANQTFLINKYKMQASYFTKDELKKVLQELRDLDYEYKNGVIDLQVGLESILCAYCSKRNIGTLFKIFKKENFFKILFAKNKIKNV